MSKQKHKIEPIRYCPKCNGEFLSKRTTEEEKKGHIDFCREKLKKERVINV